MQARENSKAQPENSAPEVDHDVEDQATKGLSFTQLDYVAPASVKRAKTTPANLTSRDVIALQRIIGNRAVSRLLTQDKHPATASKVQRTVITQPAEKENPHFKEAKDLILQAIADVNERLWQMINDPNIMVDLVFQSNLGATDGHGQTEMYINYDTPQKKQIADAINSGQELQNEKITIEIQVVPSILKFWKRNKEEAAATVAHEYAIHAERFVELVEHIRTHGTKNKATGPDLIKLHAASYDADKHHHDMFDPKEPYFYSYKVLITHMMTLARNLYGEESAKTIEQYYLEDLKEHEDQEKVKEGLAKVSGFFSSLLNSSTSSTAPTPAPAATSSTPSSTASTPAATSSSNPKKTVMPTRLPESVIQVETPPTVQRAIIKSSEFQQIQKFRAALDMVEQAINLPDYGEELKKVYEIANNPEMKINLRFDVGELGNANGDTTTTCMGEKLSSFMIPEKIAILKANPVDIEVKLNSDSVNLNYTTEKLIQILCHEVGLHAFKSLKFVQRLRQDPSSGAALIENHIKSFDSHGDMSGDQQHRALVQGTDPDYEHLMSIIQLTIIKMQGQANALNENNLLKASQEDVSRHKELLQEIEDNVKEAGKLLKHTQKLNTNTEALPFTFNKKFGTK